jgi:hypothetical protein
MYYLRLNFLPALNLNQNSNLETAPRKMRVAKKKKGGETAVPN